MEIDITSFVKSAEPYEFSGSIAERGANAGPETWHNAIVEAQRTPLLNTDEALQAMRDWAKETGAWDAGHITAWSDTELNALFIQLVSGDLRECGLDACDLDEFDWDAYQRDSEAGRISGAIFRGDVPDSDGFGKIFYYLGS